ncbi:pantoate--beta-alanine ligase [Flagellimonas sp. S3867]|uniref:pantoate--beta-alanine ligase n=1 Tax=Flagellimonas sp. S3867 TaxID=2768063 RepID=UPI0016879182|nr:pantoate--beta-alanine ligase [Flagellimonas sp. S3867]
MQVFDQKKDLIPFLSSHKDENRSVGLVPTMGALHQGHLSLVRAALDQNDVVVVSIFVNPTQFDKKDDLKKYPRNLDEDLALLNDIDKDIVVFAPSVNEIYNGKVQSESYQFDGLDQVMEGKFREGHFDGVGTIVGLLLAAVSPDKAYFGEKDFQQLQIIKKMVQLKGLPYEIVPCPIEREPHGLAMSSRNERLSQTTRNEAGFIYKTLQAAKSKFGTESANHIVDWVNDQFVKNEVLELEYFEISDEETLTPVSEKQTYKKYRAFIAVYAEGVRLIDNLRLN